MIRELSIKSTNKTQMLNMTNKIESIIRELNIKEGICIVYCPHTTAGITINENADPDVTIDIIKEINKIVPFEDNYQHFEGNSAAHIKASIFGFTQHLIIHNGKLLLGTWQGIYFCEFDGPRERKVIVKILIEE